MARPPEWLDPEAPNLAAMMFARARRWPDRQMLRAWRGGAWQSLRWSSFAARTASLARALRKAGIEAGDRVIVLSENRPEYPIAEIALMAIRAVPVPAYTTNTAADHAHVLADSGARAAIVSTAALAASLIQANTLQGNPLTLLVTMESVTADGPRTLLWDDLIDDGAGVDDIAAEAALIPGGALACIIYTSGTSGAPRGVMLPHRAILSNCLGAAVLVGPLALTDDLYLSFLPLSHSFEHTAGQFFMLGMGLEVAYARGVEHLAADMLAIRPTVMTMVPRMLEVIRGRILAAVAREPAWRQTLFHRAIDLGASRAAGTRLPPLQRLADAALERLVRRKIRARFGGRLRAAMSGGARLEPEIGRFFAGLGLVMMQGYGQTEAGPVISANPPDAIRLDSVGTPLPGVELKIAEDGEILVRGDLVMDGYWARPADTAIAIQDGWLHTGDIGTLDAENYLRITDRKRDMIVLSGGENVSPARLEGLLVEMPEIAQAVVFGDNRSALIALLVPEENHDATAVATAVTRLNTRLSTTERIRRHALVPPFTLENGLLTATQKIRRPLVRIAHADTLTKLG